MYSKVFYSRKSPRLSRYDYTTENCYFITVCTHDKKCIFGTTEKLNVFGEIADRFLRSLSSCYTQVRVDNYKVMPNHVHLILTIGNGQTKSASTIMGLYKSGVAREIRKIDPQCKVWQRSFHDRIIRNDREYEAIWEYIQYNDQKWETDCFYPQENENE